MSGFARLHALLVGDDTLAQVCRDLPESACREQPRNYGVHVVSLSRTEVGEGLADAKLVLAWLLDAIGTPTWSVSRPDGVVRPHVFRHPLNSGAICQQRASASPRGLRCWLAFLRCRLGSRKVSL